MWLSIRKTHLPVEQTVLPAQFWIVSRSIFEEISENTRCFPTGRWIAEGFQNGRRMMEVRAPVKPNNVLYESVVWEVSKRRSRMAK